MRKEAKKVVKTGQLEKMKTPDATETKAYHVEALDEYYGERRKKDYFGLFKKMKGVDVTNLDIALDSLHMANIQCKYSKKRDRINAGIPEVQIAAELDLGVTLLATEDKIKMGIIENFPNFDKKVILGSIPDELFYDTKSIQTLILDTYKFMDKQCKYYLKEHKANIIKNKGELTPREQIFYDNYCLTKEEKAQGKECTYFTELVSAFCDEVYRGTDVVKAEETAHLEKIIEDIKNGKGQGDKGSGSLLD